MITMDDEIRAVIESASTSHWLRQALQENLNRDCVDAANDAEQLNELLSRRCRALLSGANGHE